MEIAIFCSCNLYRGKAQLRLLPKIQKKILIWKVKIRKCTTECFVFTSDRRQMKDWRWFRVIESPTKAHDLSRIVSRNFFASNRGKSQALGLHLQLIYPVSGLPFPIQFWWLSIHLQLLLVYGAPPESGTHSPSKISHFSSDSSSS